LRASAPESNFVLEYIFNGSALRAVGSNGDVILPPFVRTVLERRSDSVAVVIGLHESDPCLRGYDRGYLRILHAEHERRRLGDGADDHDARARRTFGFAEEASFGADGGITLPPLMRGKGKIEELALFVGAGGAFEIWNPRSALESGDIALRELAVWRLEEFSSPAH
jgi:MraZ protein